MTDTITSPSFPSRQFLVQQAVLNAELHFHPEPAFPGRHMYLKSLVQLRGSQVGFTSDWFFDRVREEFRDLAGRYGSAT